MTDRQRDVAEIVLGFARTLRHAGVPASPDRVQAMVAALGHLDVLDPAQVFWAGRLTLCADPADLDRYDAAFAAYFGGQLPRSVPRAATLQQVLVASLDPQSPDGADGTDDGEEGRPYAVQASRQEVLRRRDVAELTHAETGGAGSAVRPADPSSRAADHPAICRCEPRRGRSGTDGAPHAGAGR